VARRWGQWRAYQNRLDPSRLVFIDETWTKTNMTSLRGWAPRGQRLPAKAPQGRWKTLIFIAALGHDRVAAPWLIEGPINGQSFLLYVEKVLVPTLKPGDIVIMDNLGSHHGKLVRAAVRTVGAKLFFLPKYSPDLNPIEMFFAKLKHWLRTAARRSSEAIYNAIATILSDVSPNQCRNFFSHPGYGRA
jgi:transposase